MIFLVAHPRTGSTAIMQAMAQTGHFLVLDEPFHPNKSHWMDQPLETGGRPATVRDRLGALGVDTSEINFAHRRPLITLAALKTLELEIGKPVFISLFPAHVHLKTLAKAMATHCTTAVILKRNPVDVFISGVKARQLKKWGDVDTTAMKIDGFFFQATSWYHYCEKIVASLGISVITIDYEAFFEEPGGHGTQAQLLAFLGHPGTSLHFAKMQQDRNDRWEDKVTNADELKQKIETYGLQGFYDSF